MLIVMCPSAATESIILFSFEADLLRRVKFDWSNRAASVAPLAFGSPQCDKRVIGASPMTTFTRAGKRAKIGRLCRQYARCTRRRVFVEQRPAGALCRWCSQCRRAADRASRHRNTIRSSQFRRSSGPLAFRPESAAVADRAAGRVPATQESLSAEAPLGTVAHPLRTPAAGWGGGRQSGERDPQAAIVTFPREGRPRRRDLGFDGRDLHAVLCHSCRPLPLRRGFVQWVRCWRPRS